MSAVATDPLAEVLERVKDWPTPRKITLARRILESIEVATTEAHPAPTRRGVSAAELHALLQMPQPAPDDETVHRWIDERRMEKYGR